MEAVRQIGEEWQVYSGPVCGITFSELADENDNAGLGLYIRTYGRESVSIFVAEVTSLFSRDSEKINKINSETLNRASAANHGINNEETSRIRNLMLLDNNDIDVTVTEHNDIIISGNIAKAVAKLQTFGNFSLYPELGSYAFELNNVISDKEEVKEYSAATVSLMKEQADIFTKLENSKTSEIGIPVYSL